MTSGARIRELHALVNRFLYISNVIFLMPFKFFMNKEVATSGFLRQRKAFWAGIINEREEPGFNK